MISLLENKGLAIHALKNEVQKAKNYENIYKKMRFFYFNFYIGEQGKHVARA